MGKKQTLTSLPPGDYSTERVPVDQISFDGGKVVDELPPGDYSVERIPQFKVYGEKIAVQDNPDQLERTIDDLDKTAKGGGGISESGRELLRGILSDPSTTPEEAKDAIMTVQGYHPKQKDFEYNGAYYVKKENGKLKPVPLSYGERPPEGYDVARLFGSNESSKDDAWYTDLAKSVYNGALTAADGVFALAQQGNMLLTNDESDYLNRMRNVADYLKVNKNEELNKPLVNLEGVDEMSDLLDKDRYDISGGAIWGTLTSLTETLTAMAGGASGIRAVSPEIGKRAATFFGSYLTQLGDNLDKNKEIGLDARDAAALAGFQTSAMALLDAISPDADVVAGGGASAAKNKLYNKLASNLEVDELGKITKESFAKMAAELPETYVTTMAQAAKEFGKDVAIETVFEGGQEFVRRAAEQLWDKLSADDKAKFGTDVTSAESFGSYIENMLAGAIGGGPISALGARSKAKFENESSNIYSTLQKGPDAVEELKANLMAAKDQGKLSQDQFEKATFKVDAFNNYYQQAKELGGINDEKKKELLELSFNIDALKAETEISQEDLSKLDPIAKGVIENKKSLMRELQKQVNEIVAEHQVQVETKVPDSEIDKLAKIQEKKSGVKSLDELIKKFNPSQPSDAMSVQKQGARAKISDFDTDKFNSLSYKNPMEAKKIVQEHLKTAENNEMPVTIRSGQNGVLTMDIGNNKQVRLAQSVQKEGLPSFLKVENIPGNKIEVDVRGGDTNMNNPSMKEYYYDAPVFLKRLEIDQFDEEGNPVVDKDGKQLRKAVLPVYNKETGNFIGFQREHRRGESRYTPMEERQLTAITEANFNSDEIAPFLYKEDKGKYSPEMNDKKAKADKVQKAEPMAARPVLLEALEQAKRDLDAEMNSEFGSEENIQAIKNEIANIERQLSSNVKKTEPEVKQKEGKPRARQILNMSLPFIKDPEALQKNVPVDTSEFESAYNGEASAAKVQSKIRKKLAILEQLSKCVNT